MSIQLWESLGDPVGLGGALSDLAVAWSMKGDLEQAEAAARAAYQNFSSVCQELEAAKARHVLAMVLMDRGRFAEAKAEIQQVIPVYRKRARLTDLAMAHQIEGSVALQMGDAAFAAAAAAQAGTVFAKMENALDGARCTWLLGRAQIAGAGGLAQGLASLEKARRVFSGAGLWIESAMILCQAGGALVAAGDRTAARGRLEELERQLPADQANAWVSDAARALRERLAGGDEASLSAEFHRLADALQRLHAPPVIHNDPAH
jgi:tetratricopeptide (TPR) repeat protein